MDYNESYKFSQRLEEIESALEKDLYRVETTTGDSYNAQHSVKEEWATMEEVYSRPNIVWLSLNEIMELIRNGSYCSFMNPTKDAPKITRLLDTYIGMVDMAHVYDPNINDINKDYVRSAQELLNAIEPWVEEHARVKDVPHGLSALAERVAGSQAGRVFNKDVPANTAAAPEAPRQRKQTIIAPELRANVSKSEMERFFGDDEL